MNRLIIAFALLISFSALANVQQASTVIQSHHLGEERTINIKLPASYDKSTTQKYPVHYVLDGQNLHDNTVFIHDFLSGKRHIPEMIIVSIPHTGQRSRDYNTFHRDSGKLNLGADAFLSFIQEEVIQYIDKQYKTTDYRLLSGHSQSGLFVFHTLIKQPELFNARFAFSPSMHHNPKQIDLLKQLFSQQKRLNGYVYVNVGGTEFFKITDAFAGTKKLFQRSNAKGLRFDFDFNEVDGHQSTPFIGQHMAYKRLFAPLRLTEDYQHQSFEWIINHFNQVSTEFAYTVKPTQKELLSMAGYYTHIVPDALVLNKLNKLMAHYYPNAGINGDIVFFEHWITKGIHSTARYFKGPKPDEDTLNSMGYRYLLEHKKPNEALFLFELSTQLYPNSSNPFDSYGEALESTGDYKLALVMYKQAYINEKQKGAEANKNYLKVFMKNIARLEQLI